MEPVQSISTIGSAADNGPARTTLTLTEVAPVALEAPVPPVAPVAQVAQVAPGAPVAQVAQVAPGAPVEASVAPSECPPAPYSVWRRLVVAESAQVEIDLMQAKLAGSPYPGVAGYDFDVYLNQAYAQLALANRAARNNWPSGVGGKLGHAWKEWFRVWSGSEHETAMAALHRAECLLLMVAPDSKLQSEALKIEANFKTNPDIGTTDPRHTAYTQLFTRLRGWTPGSHREVNSDIADRVLLREIRREQNEAWEIARSRVRIFRNILSAAIPLLIGVLVAAAFICWANPGLVSLRGAASSGKPDGSDVAVIEFLGGLGGLLSAVATLRQARNFQRFYGLPLAQSILKVPLGAASALAGILLVQHGLFGSIGPLGWGTAMSYALIFGVAQIAVTKQIDSRAGDLLGEANAKSPSTAQTASASHSSTDG